MQHNNTLDYYNSHADEFYKSTVNVEFAAVRKQFLKKELGNRVDLRFYNDKERSFHPKSYIFHYENVGEIYIGLSNISRNALTSGIERNYRFNSLDEKKNFALFYETFVDLFSNTAWERRKYMGFGGMVLFNTYN